MKYLAPYVRGWVFSVVTIPVWIVLAYVLSKLTPDPLRLWPDATVIGIGISVGLMLANVRFRRWFRD